MERINLGDKVRDKVTGLEGIATSRTEFMYGCVRVGVTMAGLNEKDGEPHKPFTADEPQLEVIEHATISNAAPPDMAAEKRTHGDRPTPISRPSVASR